jgi:Fe-S oxidoreductase
MLITLFIPCFVDLISPQAGISIVNILEGLGHQIDYPRNSAAAASRPSTPATGTKPAMPHAPC